MIAEGEIGVPISEEDFLKTLDEKTLKKMKGDYAQTFKEVKKTSLDDETKELIVDLIYRHITEIDKALDNLK